MASSIGRGIPLLAPRAPMGARSASKGMPRPARLVPALEIAISAILKNTCDKIDGLRRTSRGEAGLRPCQHTTARLSNENSSGTREKFARSRRNGRRGSTSLLEPNPLLLHPLVPVARPTEIVNEPAVLLGLQDFRLVPLAGPFD